MLLAGIILIVIGIGLGIITVGSQLFDILKLDFSEVGRNLLWVIFSIALIVIGVICLALYLIGLIF